MGAAENIAVDVSGVMTPPKTGASPAIFGSRVNQHKIHYGVSLSETL
jgi:hypothetical protein